MTSRSTIAQILYDHADASMAARSAVLTAARAAAKGEPDLLRVAASDAGYDYPITIGRAIAVGKELIATW